MDIEIDEGGTKNSRFVFFLVWLSFLPTNQSVLYQSMKAVMNNIRFIIVEL